MYDSDDPGKIFNEILITFFIPAIVVFVTLWASYRLVFNEVLLSYGLPPMVPRSGGGAISVGYGRMGLLIVLTAVIVVAYIVVYNRFLRSRLRRRGLV